jgi:hypothetical protein
LTQDNDFARTGTTEVLAIVDDSSVAPKSGGSS